MFAEAIMAEVRKSSAIMYSSWRLGKIQIKAPKHGFGAYLYFAKYQHYAVLRP